MSLMESFKELDDIKLNRPNTQVAVQTPYGPLYVFLEPDGTLTIDLCLDQAESDPVGTVNFRLDGSVENNWEFSIDEGGVWLA